ncbi:MAG: Flp family type IVb pilin [Actinomycetota bacterium]
MRRILQAISRRRSGGARGATLVEYSLGMGLVAVALIGALQFVQGEAEDELGASGGSIGHPAAEGVTSTTTGGGGGGGGATTTTPTTAPPAYTGTIQGDCTGTNGNKNDCVFSLNPDPSPTVPVWDVVPPTGFTGVPPVVTFTAAGSRSIRADVGGVIVQRVVTCSVNGAGKVTCNLA